MRRWVSSNQNTNWIMELRDGDRYLTLVRTSESDYPQTSSTGITVEEFEYKMKGEGSMGWSCGPWREVKEGERELVIAYLKHLKKTLEQENKRIRRDIQKVDLH